MKNIIWISIILASLCSQVSAQNKIQGFEFSGTGKAPISMDTLRFFERVTVSELSRYMQKDIYISSVNRSAKLVGIDTTLRTVTVLGDKSQRVVLDKNSGRVFLKTTLHDPVTISCPTTETKARYKVVKEQNYWKDSRGRIILSKTDRSGYLKPTSFGSKEVSVLDGYETIACKKCKGTGFIQGQKAFDRYKRIDFEADKIRPVSGFGSKEFISEEAQKYLTFYYSLEGKEDVSLGVEKYLKNLQYEWINKSIYEDFFYDHYARLVDEIYTQDKKAALKFILNMSSTAVRETLLIISQKDPAQRAYYREEAKKLTAK